MADRDLRKFFQNPPKGGNQRGVQTVNSMSPLPAPSGSQNMTNAEGGGIALAQQEQNTAPLTNTEAAQVSLRTTFEAGEFGSRNNQQHSARSGAPEFRNYTRGERLTRPGTPNGAQQYDEESVRSGYTGRVNEAAHADDSPGFALPRLTLEPDTSGTRSDGKASPPMPLSANQNSPNFRPDGKIADGIVRDNPTLRK